MKTIVRRGSIANQKYKETFYRIYIIVSIRVCTRFHYPSIYSSVPLMQVTNQSNPSKRPFPFSAEVSWMDHCRFRISGSPRASLICWAFMAPFWSCLLAKTNRIDSFSSSSSSMAASSPLATGILSVSALSTTKMMASVFG